MTFIVVLLTILSILIGRIIYYRVYILPQKITYEQELFASLPRIICNYDFKEEIYAQIDNYKNLNGVSNFVENNFKSLSFPVPSDPNKSENNETIIKELTSLFDNNSLAFVGVEQIILSVFPPDQLAEFVVYGLESIATHSSNAVADSLFSLKASIAEGAVNIHNPDILIDCLRHFGAGILDYINNPYNAHNLVYAINHENYAKIFTSIFNVHSIVQGLEPAMNLNQHFAEIGHSWSNNIHDSYNNISEHISVNYHPDVTGHIPYITLILSGVREIYLLNEGNTTFENSLKNISLDVAGTGIGALAGAKIGTLAGTAICPGLGTLIGGAIGSIAGAIGGRSATNNLKNKPLRDSIENYRSKYGEMLSDTKNCAISSVEKVRSVALESRDQFIDNIGFAPRLDPDQTEIVTICNELSISVNDDLDKFEKRFKTLKQSKFASYSKYREIIYRYENEINEIRQQIPNEGQIIENPLQSLHSFLEIKFIDGDKYQQKLSISLEELTEINKNLRTLLLIWCTNAASIYKKSIYNIADQLKIQAENYNNTCLFWKDTLKQKELIVKNEKNKLGIA